MSASRSPRKFLVVIDRTPECAVALRFATRRAQHTNGRNSAPPAPRRAARSMAVIASRATCTRTA